MPLHKQTEKKDPKKNFFKKHLWQKLLVVLVILFLGCGGVAAAIVLANNTPAAVVNVKFDPIKLFANNNLQEHLNSAEQFQFVLSEGSEQRSQDVNEVLQEGESLKFCYQIKNEGPGNVSWNLNFEDILNSGFRVQVQLGEFEMPIDFHEGDTFPNKTLARDETDNVYIFISVANPIVTSSISGVVVLTISVG